MGEPHIIILRDASSHRLLLGGGHHLLLAKTTTCSLTRLITCWCRLTCCLPRLITCCLPRLIGELLRLFIDQANDTTFCLGRFIALCLRKPIPYLLVRLLTCCLVGLIEASWCRPCHKMLAHAHAMSLHYPMFSGTALVSSISFESVPT